jgi:hypothetical protein
LLFPQAFLCDLGKLLLAIGAGVLDFGPLHDAGETKEVATVYHSLELCQLLCADAALWCLFRLLLLF